MTRSIRGFFGMLIVTSLVVHSASAAEFTASAIARARSLELPTEAEAPPGDPLLHYAAGYAQILCQAVFISELELDFAKENIGFFTAPYAVRAKLGNPEIDREQRTVKVPVPGGPIRLARDTGGQGCVAMPIGESAPYFNPRRIVPAVADPASTDWPMGDREPDAPLEDGVDLQQVRAALDAAFRHSDGLTAAVVITWRGRVIGERYGPGVGPSTRLESWSMGKSVTATLMGVLIENGVYSLDQRAPIPEWQGPGDGRAEIRIADLLHMSSGLRIRAPYDPDFDPSGPYPEHLYYYTGTTNAFHYAATRPQQWPPNTVGRYRNTDPVLVNYLIRLGVEGRGMDYPAFPQRALFDRIGVRSMVIETDPYGNFLAQGAELATARDWARLGNLYLQDGVWNGERILPKGYTTFVSTLAPAWEADHNPVYGGFFWLNGDEEWPIPKSAYFMAGAGGQYTFVIPSHDLVVVKLDHYRGNEQSDRDLQDALSLLMRAVPQHP